MEFNIAFAALVTALATTITALAAAILANYNRHLLNRIDKKHSADIFFKALPYRLGSYEELKKQYSHILKGSDFRIWSYDRNNALIDHKLDNIRTSLNDAEMFFANEGNTRKIFQLIKSVQSKIELHDENVRSYYQADSKSPSLDEIKPYEIKCKESSEALKSEYVKLTTKIEDLLKKFE